MVSRTSRVAWVVFAAGAVWAGGCASDQRVATTTGKVRLTATREPFTFSSWDVRQVEWAAPANDAHAVPPNVAAVLSNGSVLPLRSLTLDRAKATPGLTAAPPARVDDGHGTVFAQATPVTGSGFTFDFVGGRLVRFVAAPYDNAGSPAQPVFRALDVDREDAFGDVKQYVLPLTHDECVDLFGGAAGLETELALPAILP